MLLVPGGSGVVPLRAMLRHQVAAHSPAAMRLLYSARSPRDLVYGQELGRLADVDPGVDVQLTFTRHWPANWNGRRGRRDRGLLGRIRLGRRRSDR